MKLFQQIDQLNKIHKLIREGHTGTPNDFARMMGISARHLYTIIDEMRSRGAPIIYSRTTGSYYYKYPFDLQLNCRFTSLNGKEYKEINAGSKYLKTYFLTACFVQ